MSVGQQSEHLDRSLLGSFVAGDDVELATPSVLYELGCPGCDLTVAFKVRCPTNCIHHALPPLPHIAQHPIIPKQRPCFHKQPYAQSLQEVNEDSAVASDMRLSTAGGHGGGSTLRPAPNEAPRRRLPRLLSGDSGSDDAGAPVGTPSAADGLRRLALWGPHDAPAPALPKTFNIRCAHGADDVQCWLVAVCV